LILFVDVAACGLRIWTGLVRGVCQGTQRIAIAAGGRLCEALPVSRQGFMLEFWISSRKGELLAGTPALDTGILLVKVGPALKTAPPAALKVISMSTMRTVPPVHFTTPL
jgi:hypothetical protein